MLIQTANGEYRAFSAMCTHLACTVQFEAESQRLAKAIGPNLVAVHHIGSTAIPNIYAKPIIDLLVEVVSDDRDDFLEFLECEIHNQPDVADVETMTGLKNYKNQFLLKRNWS